MAEGKADTEAAVGTVLNEQDVEAKTKKPLSFHLSFLALSLMVLMVSMDATALAVAIPVIAHDLNSTTLEAFWANLSFLLVQAVCQPIYTSVSDIFGRMASLYSSFAWFVVGSIIFATAHSMPVLIVGRVFQGIGAGGLDVLGEIILVDMTTLKERPMYLGLFAIPLAAGTILGPIIGALFSQYVGWRWLGWLNLPISFVGLVLIVFFLRLKAIELSFHEKIRRVDWIGIVLFGLGATAFASPLSWAGTLYPWKSWQTLLPFFIGFVILGIFGLYENGTLNQTPRESIFPTRIFKTSTASVTLAASFLHGAVVYSATFYLPLMLQAVFLEKPLKSAISLLPLCCTSVGFSIIAGVLVEVLRKYKWGIIISWAITATGCGLIALWNRESSLALKSGIQVLLGVGLGPFFTLLVLPIQTSVANADDAGMAAGILVSFRLFGALVSLAMCSTVFSNVFTHSIASLRPLPDAVAALADVRVAVEFIPLLRKVQISPALLAGIDNAYRKAFIAVFLMLAGFAVLGFLVSFFIKEMSIESDELGRQQMIEEKKDS